MCGQRVQTSGWTFPGTGSIAGPGTLGQGGQGQRGSLPGRALGQRPPAGRVGALVLGTRRAVLVSPWSRGWVSPYVTPQRC